MSADGKGDRLISSFQGDLVPSRFTRGVVLSYQTGEGGYFSGPIRTSLGTRSTRELAADLFGLNARGVALSPDGSTFYYVHYRPNAGYSVISRTLKSGRQTVLYATPEFDRHKKAIQFGQLVASPSGSDLMFARTESDGFVTTQKLSIATRRVSTLLRSSKQLVPRSWSPNGRFVWMEPLCGDCPDAYVMDITSGKVDLAIRTDSTTDSTFVGWIA